MIRTPTLTDMFLVALVGMIWGTAFLAIKVAVGGASPASVAFIRVAIGFVIVLAYALLRGLRLPAGRASWDLVALAGLTSLALPFLLISWAETRIDSGVAALIMGAGPLISVFVGHATSRDDRLTRYKLIGASMGLAGLVILFGGAALAGMGSHLLAQAATFAAVLSYVASGVIIRRIEGLSSESLTACVMGVAVILLLPAALYAGFPSPGETDGKVWIALVWLGAIPTGLAFLLRFHLIRAIGLSRAAQGVYLVPVTGLILGALILGEKIAPTAWLALAMIAGGIVMSQRGGARASREAVDAP